MRLIDSPIGQVIPVVDIAENIGYSRSSITKTLNKYSTDFEGLKTFQTLPTAHGAQQFLCLNLKAIDRLILHLNPAENRQELYAKVQEFRIKAYERMDQGQILLATASEPKKNLNLDDELVKAGMLAEKTGAPLKSFQAIALRKCGFADYASALEQHGLVHGEKGWHNPTELCEILKDPLIVPGNRGAEMINTYLKNQGFQYRDWDGLWRLTEKGEPHGQEYWYETTTKHREIRIRWRESILIASGLKRTLSPDQARLTAGGMQG